MSPLKTSWPVAESLWIETLCGIPASLLANTIWNGVLAGASSVDLSYAMPLAVSWSETEAPGAALAAAEPAGPLAEAALAALAAAEPAAADGSADPATMAAEPLGGTIPAATRMLAAKIAPKTSSVPVGKRGAGMFSR